MADVSGSTAFDDEPLVLGEADDVRLGHLMVCSVWEWYLADGGVTAAIRVHAPPALNSR